MLVEKSYWLFAVFDWMTIKSSFTARFDWLWTMDIQNVINRFLNISNFISDKIILKKKILKMTVWSAWSSAELSIVYEPVII